MSERTGDLIVTAFEDVAEAIRRVRERISELQLSVKILNDRMDRLEQNQK